jgi:hypothetical protein
VQTDNNTISMLACVALETEVKSVTNSRQRQDIKIYITCQSTLVSKNMCLLVDKACL